jgi:hypothetical protein
MIGIGVSAVPLRDLRRARRLRSSGRRRGDVAERTRRDDRCGHVRDDERTRAYRPGRLRGVRNPNGVRSRRSDRWWPSTVRVGRRAHARSRMRPTCCSDRTLHRGERSGARLCAPRLPRRQRQRVPPDGTERNRGVRQSDLRPRARGMDALYRGRITAARVRVRLPRIATLPSARASRPSSRGTSRCTCSCPRAAGRARRAPCRSPTGPRSCGGCS